VTIAVIIGSAVVMHLLATQMIHRSVKRWIKGGRSRQDSVMEAPEETVELQLQLMSQRRAQRAQAIGQLLRNFLVLVIWGTAVLLVLAELGVNIAPVMASAGVVGVALGFGAQTLVKDFLSGFFLIVEDQYGVGDIVDLGAAVGTVEEVSLRVTRLRDLTGVVWYVRNGEILRVANQSQGWTMAIAVVPVSYDTDLTVVRRIVIEVGTDMVQDPQTAPKMLGRPQFSGVESVSGEAVYVRVVAKARGGQQVALTRDLRERLKVAFDRAGVRVPAIVRPMHLSPDGVPLPPGAPPPAAPL
jgi:small-conductance mechanosensitive channel